jgi:plasmid stabilization system protein ParE
MPSTVLFKRAARAEISNIAEYLEEQRPGFGRRFMDDIKRVEDLLRDNPAQYQQLHDGIRRAVLRRFRTVCSTWWRVARSSCWPAFTCIATRFPTPI